MEQFEEHISDEASELLEAEFHDHGEPGSRPEEHHEQSAWTDDPVRVYLREMGSVSLLSRQCEIDLAQRIERGKLRMRKALSRSPPMLRRVLAIHRDVSGGQARLDDFFEIGGTDDTAKENARREVTRRLGVL